jgi:hypothetical protein
MILPPHLPSLSLLQNENVLFSCAKFPLFHEKYHKLNNVKQNPVVRPKFYRCKVQTGTIGFLLRLS